MNTATEIGTCEECNGQIIRNDQTRGWLHRNPSDWIIDRHRATPKKVD